MKQRKIHGETVLMIILGVAVLLAMLGMLLLIWGYSCQERAEPSARYLLNELGIVRDEYAVLYESDSHGGFHGDGMYSVALDCSDHMEEIQRLSAGWRELPLPENLELMLYGGERGGVSYEYRLAEEAHFERVENGCFIFNNQHSRAAHSWDDDIFGKYSFNFSIGIFDRDTNILYFLQYDT